MSKITAEQLNQAETRYKAAEQDAEKLRQQRNTLVLQALDEGWTHAAISKATGLSRGRISQFRK